ncbi:MAG: DUF5693 family protein [Armatimonadota bacterium]
MNKKLIWIILLLVFVFSAYVVYNRIDFENEYNNIELILDYDEVYKKCAFTGSSLEDTLLSFKKAGITTVAFNEQTVEDLINYGRISLIPRENTGNYPVLFLQVNKDNLYNDTQLITNKFKKYLPHAYKGTEKGNIIEVSASYGDIIPYGIGFDPYAINEVNNMGFNVILRPRNKINLNADLLQEYWNEILGIKMKLGDSFSGIIFGGIENEVLGYPSLLGITSVNIRELKGLLGVLEAGSSEKVQKGINYLEKHNSPEVVRVMSISEAYLAKLDPKKTAGKFILGVKERNIRWVYLHLFSSGFYGDDITKTNLNMVSSLKGSLTKNFNFSKADKMPYIHYSYTYLAIIIIFLIILFFFLIDDFIKLSNKIKILLFIISILTILVLFMYKTVLLIKLTALVGAVLFIILAFKSGLEFFKERTEIKGNNEIFSILLTFLLISVISLTGGLITASLLFKNQFLLNICQFTGVKLLMILPPVLVLYWYLTKQAGKSYKEIFSWPLTWGQAVLLLVFLALGVYYILRTGNTADGIVMPAEKTFRSFLNDILVVRPRLKEVFFAHPALILALTFIKEKRNIVLCGLFLLFGAVGQADIIDTFAHAHTPAVISLIRCVYGIFFGAVIGFIYWGVYKLIFKGRNG